jgi:hypothetical protein
MKWGMAERFMITTMTMTMIMIMIIVIIRTTLIITSEPRPAFTTCQPDASRRRL